MKSKFAMVQMESVADPAENLKKAAGFVKEAMELCNPKFIVFPETFMSETFGEIRERNAWAECLDGPFVTGMKKLAKDKKQRAKADLAYAKGSYLEEMEQNALKSEAQKMLA